MADNLYETLDRLNDEELSLRVKSGYYSDSALAIAKEILSKRGLPVPEVVEGYIQESVPFRKRHPILFWTFFGAFVTAIGRAVKHFVNS